MVTPDHQSTTNDGQAWPIERFLIRLEEIVLAGILLVIIVLSCYQICLRWFTQGGLAWIDPLLRYLVLWGGLLGAALATARSEHISLDVFGYLLKERAKLLLSVLIHIFSLLVAVLLVRATLLFLKNEIAFGSTSLFDLPTWLWNLIFPVAFVLICAHFLINGVRATIDLITFRRNNHE